MAMEKMLRIVKELNTLKSHHEDAVKSADVIGNQAIKMGDAALILTISEIRKKSETSIKDIGITIEHFHLKINELDSK